MIENLNQTEFYYLFQHRNVENEDMKKASLLTLFLIGLLIAVSAAEGSSVVKSPKVSNSTCDPNGQDSQCGYQRKCEKIGDTYHCNCIKGFQANENDCEDFDECTQKHFRQQCKSKGAICQNSYGSYKCKCKPGFHMDQHKQHCVDDNECEEMELCHEKAICENTVGSYRCACAVGFAGDGVECVVDEVYEQQKKIKLIIMIGSASGGGALLIIALIAFCYCAGNKKKDKKDRDKIEKIESTFSEYGQDWESSDSSEDEDD